MKRTILISILILVIISPVYTGNTPIKPVKSLQLSQSRDYVTQYNQTEGKDLWDLTTINDTVYITEYNTNHLWQYNTQTDNLSSIDFAPDITPLFVNRGEDNTSLWILDYDYTPQEEPLDHVLRYDIETGNVTMFDLPPQAHAVNFGVSNGYAIVTLLNQDAVILINTETYNMTRLDIPCDDYCGPAGADFDQDGNLWITETLSDRFVKYSFETGSYTFYAGVPNFESPTYLRFDKDNTFWTGEHAGDKIANVNITDMSYEVYASPKPNKGQYPTSGVNDIEFIPNGDVWFAEHFINRVGRLHRDSGTVMEYIFPRKQPLVALIHADQNKLWYAETYGYFSYFDLNEVPTVEITPITTQQLTDSPTLPLNLTVKYDSGITDSLSFSVFGEVKLWNAFGVSAPQTTYSLDTGQQTTIPVTIGINGRADAGNYTFVLGIKTETFTASQQFTLIVTQDWDNSVAGSSSPFTNLHWYDLGYLVIALLVILNLYIYRKSIAKLLKKITQDE